MKKTTACTSCGGTGLYRSKQVSAGGGYAPNYLPGLGNLLVSARFHLVMCKDCGLTQFFAERAALEKLSKSRSWKRV